MLSPTDECQGICMHHYPTSAATTTTTLTTNNRQNSETPNTTQNVQKEEPGKLIDYFNNE